MRGGALELAEGLVSEAPGCSWEELGERLEELARGCPWALLGTPAKIKERESKESQVEKKLKR